MHLKISKLQVTNFRNLNSDVINFGPNINCIFGDNGNGKTNILEAVNVLVTRKSFRKNTTFSQFLSMDGEKPEIIFSSIFSDSNEDSSLTYSGKFHPEGSQWYMDSIPTKKKIDTRTVFINPFDSNYFHSVGSFRRKWIDSHLSQLNDIYKKNLNKYNTALKFRNSLLSKKPPKYREQITAIDMELAQYSVFLTESRKAFLVELRDYCGKIFQEIFSEEHDLNIVLDTKFSNFSVEQVYEILQKNLEKEEIIGRTVYGVHKDDYVLLFDGINSFDYCSLGQQKMSYLSLLFAYIELFRYKFSSFPIVLIDDVSGELDRHRWQRLIGYLRDRKFQVLITTANEKFKEELEKIEGARRIYVDQGAITES